jgi:hypothetical protein
MNLLKRHWPLIIVAVLLAFYPVIAFAQDVTSNTQQVNGVPTALMMWSAIIGFWLPTIIAAINRYNWSPSTKGALAFLVCLVVAAGTTYYSGDLAQIKDYGTAALFVIFTAMGSYQVFWKPSGIAPKIEQKTG